MTPAESRRVAAIEAELAALKRSLANAKGIGVNTTNGATNYRTTQLGFAAELTAAWDAADGYAWKRLRLVGVTTGNPAIQLTGTGAVTPGGDESLDAGTRGWMEPSPDAQGYYFIADDDAAPPNAGNVDGWCGWFDGVSLDSCWTFYRNGGVGAFENFPVDDVTDEGVGIVAVYNSTHGGWVGAAGNTPSSGLTGSGMLTTCCGCGSVTLKKVDSKPVLVLGGVHVSCRSAGEVFTETIDDPDYRCLTLADGRRAVEFFGTSRDVCDDDEEVCGNWYSILAVCNTACPAAACGCQGCGPAATPVGWAAFGLTGFDPEFNGDWVWVRDPAEDCTFVGRCNPDDGSDGGAVSTLTFVGDPGTGEWQLEHGGYTFTAAYSTGVCNGVTVFTTGLSSGPDDITMYPLKGSTAECCSGLVRDDIPDSFTVSIDAPGCPTADGVSVVVEYDAGLDLWDWVNPGADANRVTTVEVSCDNGILVVGIAGVCGAFTFGIDTTGIVPSGTPTADPFDVVFEGVPVDAQVGADAGCCADGTATVTLSA